MNLIQQLQTTPKWKEFEEWYSKQKFYLPLYDFGTFDNGFVKYEFEFQKGVFEKFIAKDGLDITVDGYLGDETYGISGSSPTFADWKWFDNFKQLLLWYFNN